MVVEKVPGEASPITSPEPGDEATALGSERLAWIAPLVLEMRDRLRRIELSAFWRLRNRFFALKNRLGFTADASWETFAIPQAYADLLEESDRYTQWRVRHDPRPADLAGMRETIPALAAHPRFGIVLVGDVASAEFAPVLAALRAQIYPYWSIAADASGEHAWIVYLEAGDRLAPEALYALAVTSLREPEADVIYADEDALDAGGRRTRPQFKPGWSPETLLSRDYLGGAVAYRSALLATVGGLAHAFGPAARYDLALRATERARSVAHVAQVLLHRGGQQHASDAPDCAAHAMRAIAAALERRGEAASVVASGPRSFVVRYASHGNPRVTIVLPTRDHAEDLERCLASVFGRTTYANFELLLVDNGTREPAARDVIERYARADARLRVVPMDVPFNYSRLNNAAVAHATGETIVLLNNDTEVVSPDWIEALVEQARRPAIGAVGAHLLYPDGRVQHGGVILGIGGVAGHSHRGHPPGDAGYFGALRTVTNYSAVTAACLAVRRSVYEEVGGLDETLTVAFNDVDFCLRVRAAGYRNVWLPHVVLRHGESLSRGHDVGLARTHRSLAESRVMLERWHATIDDDPYYSPHLTRLDESYDIRVEI